MLQDDNKSNTEGDSEWNKQFINEIRRKEGKLKSITEKDRIERLQECLDEGANIDVVDKDNKDDNTALHIAVEKGYKEVAKFLVQKRAKTDITNKNGHTALTLAKALGKEDILSAITEFKVNRDKQSPEAERSSPSIKIVSLASQRASTSQDEASTSTNSSNNSQDTSLKRKAAGIEDIKNGKERRCEISYDLQIEAHRSEDSQSEEDIDDESNRQGTSAFGEKNEYAASGLKQTLHGNIYQLKLLMLFVKRGLQEGYAFRLATEIDAAEKFDDVVFRYADRTGSGTICRYLQAKHRQDESRTISTSDLLNKEEGDFSLQKYFVSYRKIKEHPELKKSKLEDCILCTNIDFDLRNRRHEQSKFRVQKDDERDLRPEDLGISEIGLVKVRGSDAILDVKNSPKQFARYKLVINDRHELHETLRESSDAYLLAKALAKHAFNKTKMTLRTEIFKSYHIALATHVIDVNNKCFSPTFSDNDENLSPEVRRFRKIFGAEFLKLMKLDDGNASEETIRAGIQKSKLEFSEYFGQKFKSKGSSLTNLKEFSEAFVRLIRKANNDNLIVIDREIYKRNAEEDSDEKVIGADIDRLAGCALIVEDRKIKFDSKFFTDNMDSELSDNMQAFKNELQTLLDKEYEDLEKYRFEVKNSPRYWDLLYATSKLPDDHIESKDILEFFEKLIFAVNQPNEIELGKIIQKEIGECSRFNVLSADLVSNSFQIKMLNWFKKKGKGKGKEGRFFTSNKGEAFFKSMEDKIGNLICFGLGSSYPEELEEYGIEFEDENQQLKDFLDNEDERILNLIAIGETLPTAMRVYKTIRKQAKYKKDHSLIFMRLRSLRPVKTRELVTSSFESSQRYDLLVIDCESFNIDNLQILYDKLRSVIEKERNSAKKLIFITQKIEKSSSIKSYAMFQNCKPESDEVCFNNLSKASREKLLNKPIINLQGLREKPISFLKLLGVYNMSENLKDFEDAIDSGTLVKLICGEEIILGTDLNTLGDIEDCYIARTFNRLVFLREKILKSQPESDVFAISGIDANGLARFVMNPGQIRSFGEIDWETTQSCKFIILDSEQVTDQFATVCAKYSSDEYNVHWVVKESGKLIWKQSRGHIGNLLKYRRVDNYKADEITNRYLPEGQLADHNDGVKVVIISGPSGMGKSTVLTSLARKMKDKQSDTWVIRIDLNDFTKVLEREKEKEDRNRLDEAIDDQVVEFFVEKLVKLDTDFEKTVLKTMIKHSGEVVLLVDGFDEISPDYKEIVIIVLRRIKNMTGVKKLIISTRPHMTEVLEMELETFSYTMVRYSQKNQIEFLSRFWEMKKKLVLGMDSAEQRNAECFTVSAKELIEKVARSIGDSVGEFFSIPLQVRMIAELCEEDTEHIAQFSANISIVDLYKNFVEKKFLICYAKKSKADLSNIGMKDITAAHRKASLKMHQEFALYTLFSTKDLKTLLNTQQRAGVRTTITRVCEGKEKTGIIDDKAKFIHRSFAEYFAAIFLINKLKDEHSHPKLRKFILEKILHQREYNIIRSFMNGLLHASSSLQDGQYKGKASADGSWRLLLEQSLNTFFETIFHIAVKERNDEIMKFFLIRFGEKDLISHFLDEAKDRTNETALYVAASSQHWEGVKLLVEHGGASVNCSNSSGRTPLHEAVSSGNLPMVKWLIENGADVHAKSVEDQTPLHWAMLSSELDILEYLIDATDVDINLLLGDTRISDYPSSVVKWLSEKACTSSQRNYLRGNISDADSVNESQSIKRSATSLAVKRPRRNYKQEMVKNEPAKNNKKRRREPPGNDLQLERQAALNSKENHDNKSRQEIADFDEKNEYSASDSKQTLHGHYYQLRLVMLLLIRALREGYAFSLATDVYAAEKLDDIVFGYKKQNESETVWQFFQVKHMQDESKKISARDLFNVRDTGFNLKEYFISYRQINRHPEMFEGKSKDYVVWTNVDFDSKKLERAGIKLLEVKDPEFLLATECSSKKPARYKFLIDEESQLYEILKNSSHVYGLAKALAEHVVNKKFISLQPDIFKLYHTVLASEVVNIRTKKFSANFIKGQNLSEIVTNFRKMFAEVFSELMERRGERVSEEIIWRKIDEETLKLSENFGKQKYVSEPKKINRKEFSQEFIKLLKNADDRYLVEVCGVNNIVADGIKNLIGSVLVEAENKGIYKFGSLFLNDSIPQPSKTEGLKNSLKTQLGSKYKNLAQFQFEIQTRLHPTIEFPADVVEDWEIADFLDNLIFAVNQANQVELEDIIMREIDKASDLHLLGADLTSSTFTQKFSDLIKEKSKGQDRVTFLTPEDGRTVLNSIESDAKTLAYSLMSSVYPKKLTNYGIEFEDHRLSITLRQYLLCNTNKPALKLISAGDTLPTAIKVHCIIQKIPNYTNLDSFIFMQHRTLLASEIRNRVIRAFGSRRRHDLLVIECGSDNKEHLEELCNDLYEIIEQYSTKKLILITTDSNIQSNIHFKDYKEKGDEVSFNNLTQASQQKLLQQPCLNVQGNEEMSFRKLLGKRICNDILSRKSNEIRRVIDSSTLVNLIRGDNITVGNGLEDLGEIAYFYVNRKMDRQVFLKKDILVSELESDVFAISGIDKEGLGKLVMDEEKIVSFDKIDSTTPQSYKCIILDDELDEKQFEKLCAEYLNNDCNVHWLKNESENFIWKQSRGSIGNLAKYRDAGKSHSHNSNVDKKSSFLMDDQLAEPDGDCKVIIISGNAGMGKTTLFTRVGIDLKQQDSDLWVIGIDLYDFTGVLEEERKRPSFNSGDVHEAVDFFVEKFSKLRTDLEKIVLKAMIENDGKVVLLFDGFDDISPRHEKTVIHILQAMQNSVGVKKLFISTRQHTRRALETELGIFSYTMMPFNEVNQVFFFNKFWGRMKSGRTHQQLWKLERQAKALIQQYADSVDEKLNDFIGIPLQLQIIAEIYQDRAETCEEFPLLQKKVKIVDLYRSFIATQNHIYCSEMGQEESEQLDELFSEPYLVSSLYALFDTEDLVALLNQQKMKSINNNACETHQKYLRMGIITSLIHGEPKFTHRTFPEFFTAMYLVNMLNQGDHNPRIQKFIIEEILLQPNHNVIRAFLNGLLLEKSSSSDSQTSDNMSEDNASWRSTLEKCRGEFGETIFHIAAKEGHDEIIKFFFNRFGKPDEIQNFLNNVKDDVGQTALEVAVSHQHRETHNLLVEYGGTCSDSFSTLFGEILLHDIASSGNSI